MMQFANLPHNNKSPPTNLASFVYDDRWMIMQLTHLKLKHYFRKSNMVANSLAKEGNEKQHPKPCFFFSLSLT